MYWKEPYAVSNWEWRHKVWPTCKYATWLFWKWSLLLGIPVVLALRVWFPIGIRSVSTVLGAYCIFKPAMLILSFWFYTNMGMTCSIHKRGISKSSGQGGSFCKWEHVIYYRFSDFAEVPGVRCLCITFKRNEQEMERQFRFSPQEVNEEKVEYLLMQYLPLITKT